MAKKFPRRNEEHSYGMRFTELYTSIQKKNSIAMQPADVTQIEHARDIESCPSPRTFPHAVETTIRFLACAIQTPIMHDRIVRAHGDDAAPEAFMAHAADPLIRDNDAPIPAAIISWDTVAE
jgi:hypothetical protein